MKVSSGRIHSSRNYTLRDFREQHGTLHAFQHCFIRIVPEPDSALGTRPLTLSVISNDWGIFSDSRARKVQDYLDDVDTRSTHRVEIPCGKSPKDFDEELYLRFIRDPELLRYSNNPLATVDVDNSNTFVRRLIERNGGTLPEVCRGTRLG